MLARMEPLLRAEVSTAQESGSAIPAVAACIADASSTAAEAPLEETQSFFAQQAEQGQVCVDCSSADADWASVSYGAYLCMDCAGRHRGLGVHLSFVRSTTMDRWSREQLRRMQMGGSKRLRGFFQTYPELQAAPTTKDALATRYRSRAATHYRRLLDARCRESQEEAAAEEARLPPAPGPMEGHLPEQPQGALSPTGGMPPSASTTSAVDNEDDADAEPQSVDKEREALKTLYHSHRGQRSESDDATGPVPGDAM